MSISVNGTSQKSQDSQFELVDFSYDFTPLKIKVHAIDVDLIKKISFEIKNLYKKLEYDNTFQKNLISQLWKFRVKLLTTTSDYDSNSIGITSLIKLLGDATVFLPSIIDEVRVLSSLLELLRANPSNIKVAKLRTLIASADEYQTIGIYSQLVTGSRLTWDESERKILEAISDRIILVDTRKQLISSYFDNLIVWSGFKLMNLKNAQEIVFGGHARELTIFHYAQEHLSMPTKLIIPVGKPFYRNKKRADPIEELSDYEISSVISKVDDFVIKGLIDSFKTSLHDDNDDGYEIVKARFVLFTNGAVSLLPTDGKVIELSDYFDTKNSTEINDLPRKRVIDLEEDDLVVLRTAGGGEYVELIADELMRKDQKTDLRKSALEWKTPLKIALHRAGDDKFLRQFKLFGGKVRSSGYLHEWAGSNVISPRDQNDFMTLIKTVDCFEKFNIGADSYAIKKWTEIQLLKNYHHKAGTQIRNKLLEEIKKRWSVSKSIGAELIISLPGIQGAEMALLRIAAIDSESTDVSSSRLFRLEKPRVK